MEMVSDRIASTTQHPIGIGTEWSISHDARGIIELEIVGSKLLFTVVVVLPELRCPIPATRNPCGVGTVDEEEEEGGGREAGGPNTRER